MKYYIKIVEDCTPKLVSFKTKKKMDQFLKKFETKVDKTGTWVDFIIKGELIFAEEYYRD